MDFGCVRPSRRGVLCGNSREIRHMSKKIKLGVIGAGRIGRVHAETIAYRISNAEVTMISDVRLEAARTAAADFGIPQVAEDYHEILKNKDIQGVVICSSTDTH